jgi:YVTN family beta-propeller protein
VTPDGTKIYVMNSDSSTISVIDAATNKVIATIPLGQNSSRVAASPDGTKMYILDINGISVIDTATNTLTVTIPVKGFLNGIAVAPDGSKIYVTNPDFDANFIPKGRGTVLVIDAVTSKVIATVLVGYTPLGIAVTPDGSKIYVTNEGQSTVSVIDASTNKKIATIRVDDRPMGVAVTPDGTKIYVANGYSNTVSVIEVATDKVIATIPVGVDPEAIGLFITPVILKSTTSATPTSSPSSTASASPTQTPFVGVAGIGAVLICTVFCISAMRKKR